MRVIVCGSRRWTDRSKIRDWDVIELPVEFIDPRLYVCSDCLRPSGQLDLEQVRVEERPYDPAISENPL